MSDSKLPPKNTILSDEKALLLDHDYDGIQELDHPLPRWWVWGFVCCVIFGIGYMGYYMTGPGPSSKQELSKAMAEIEALKPPSANGIAGSEPSAEELMKAFKDSASLNHGHEVYTAKCLACHGDKGQGLIGPNLTDDFWIHGTGNLADVAHVVTTGVPEKGMPPWGPVLTATELKDVVAFVHSLHGTNPAGAKPAQGNQQTFKD